MQIRLEEKETVVELEYRVKRTYLIKTVRNLLT